MTSTPSNRLRLTPSNSPYFTRSSRSPTRGRSSTHDPHLSLKRVVGTTCSSPTGFDVVGSHFAYIAGGAVVVVDVKERQYSQRFYRARPAAVPTYAVSPLPHAPSTPLSTPKANDSRNRVAPSLRDSPYSHLDWSDSPSSKTWTSRERIKAATCLALSREGKFLAVGETGYAPRVLIFSLEDDSSDTPLVSISEHTFGVNIVAWSEDSRYLASLGAANDGFLYLWKVDPRTGATRLFQQNRCTSYVRGMVWMGNKLITLGVRHVKLWRVEDGSSTSPVKQKFNGDGSSSTPQPQKTLPGRNILLGSLLEGTFSCAVAIDDTRAIICSEAGDVCLLDDANKQMKLTRIINLPFNISCITIRDRTVYAGSATGNFATLSVDSLVAGNADCALPRGQPTVGMLAMGFLADNMVTIDAKRSIDIWSANYKPGQATADSSHIPLPGHCEPVLGIQSLCTPNDTGATFFTWSGSGKVCLWDIDGAVKSSFKVPIEEVDVGNESDSSNHLTVVRATKDGRKFIAADKLGVLRIMDFTSKECQLELKAHSQDCQDIAIFEGGSRTILASCGRDRTAQLFHRRADGSFEHFQTLEFAAKVVRVMILAEDKIIACSWDRTMQVFDLISKEDEPDAMAAIQSRVISLKASPASMTMGSDEKSVYVSLLDRSVCLFDITSGRLVNSFKCTDEGGVESVVLDSLTVAQSTHSESTVLLGVSNTDKSVRIYDAHTGSFMDREWGHTEAINGVALFDDVDGNRRVVSVGSDGTIMYWILNLQEPSGPMSRDASPVKDSSVAAKPPLRRVLSKAELAEFQRSSPAATGRRSPPRTLQRRTSKYNLVPVVGKTPVSALQTSPGSIITEDTPTRRISAESRSGSPPVSPKARMVTRRPSLPALSSRKKSSGNLRAFGTLNMATEQACRTLRAYRKKLSSTEPLATDVLTELDQELRMTAAALGDRACRSKAMSESLLNGLLDEYSERLVTMLDEKLRQTLVNGRSSEPNSPEEERPRSSGRASSADTSSADTSTSAST